jgi:hypothetical protein
MEAVAGINRYRADDGPACGMRIAEVYTGAGLRYSILPDRGMDIGMASFRGVPVAFMSKGGIMRTDYALACPKGFPQYFSAGLLTTCGLENVGEPCETKGKLLRMHGSRTFLSAYDVCSSADFEGDRYLIRVRGKMRCASLFGENILLTREFISEAESGEIEIHDTIENQGSTSYAYMLMYHVNFGFPLVSPDSYTSTSHTKVFFLETTSTPEPALYQRFSSPRETFSELTFEMHKPREKQVWARLENPHIGLQAVLRYDAEALPCFTEWINLAEQDYVLGLEPGTHYPTGRNKAEAAGGLVSLLPGERREYSLRIDLNTL